MTAARCRVLWIVGVLAVVLALGPAAHAGKAVDDNAKGLERAAAWWDSLGFPDVTSLPFGRLFDGRYGMIGGLTYASYEYAFLLDETPDAYDVFLTQLERRRVSKTESQADGQAAVRFERVDIGEALAREWAQASVWPRGVKGHIVQTRNVFGIGRYFPPNRTRGFVLARALLGRGETETALAIWRRAAALKPWPRRFGGWSALRLLKKDVRSQSMTAWTRGMADTDRSFASQREAYATWLDRFDQDAAKPHHAAALANLETLAEDEARWSRRALDEVLALPPLLRAAALVDRLALVNVYAPAGHGHRDHDPGKTMSILDRLVAMGFDAVPALLAALDDGRYTHSVGSTGCPVQMGQPSLPTFEIDRVADLACRGLRRIAAISFDAPGAHAWWAQVQKVGEAAVLRDEVRRGTHSSVTAGRRLVLTHAEGSGEALIAGIRAAERDVDWEALTRLLADVPPAEVTPFLLQQLEVESAVDRRIVIASLLHALGQSEGLDALIQEWPSREFRSLVKALVDTGSPEAIRVMTRDRYELSERDRTTVIWALSRASLDAAAEREAFRAEIERFLVTQLLCADQERGVWPSPVNARRSTRRIGDAAASALARLWPDRFSFDGGASYRERDTRIVAMANAWREAHGLEPVQGPAFREIEPVPAEVVEPLIHRWLHADADEPREAAERDLVDAGLGTLPALRAARARLSEEDDASQGLSHLIRRISSIVWGYAIEHRSWQPDEALTRLLDDIKGKPLTADRLAGIPAHVAGSLPEGATGIVLWAYREGHDSGFVVTLGLTTRHYHWGGKKTGWTVDGQLHTGRRALAIEEAWAEPEAGRTTRPWAEYATVFDEAIETRPSTVPLWARVRLVLVR